VKKGLTNEDSKCAKVFGTSASLSIMIQAVVFLDYALLISKTTTKPQTYSTDKVSKLEEGGYID
jgi:hypothetical protein